MSRKPSIQTQTNCCKTKSFGGAGYRSRYLSHAKRALYHLSYAPCLGIKGNESWYNYNLSKTMSLRTWPVQEGGVRMADIALRRCLGSPGSAVCSVLTWPATEETSITFHFPWFRSSYLRLNWLNCLIRFVYHRKLSYGQGTTWICVIGHMLNCLSLLTSLFNNLMEDAKSHYCWIRLEALVKKEGSSGIWTRDLSHPKRESYP